MTHDEAMRIIHDSNFAQYARYLEPLLLPSLQLYAERVELDELPPGASRLGGVPDVPAGFAWPRGANGEALAFLAQLRLEDVRPADPTGLLPGSGWLVFFYDATGDTWGQRGREYTQWRVIHSAATTEPLQRASAPANAAAPEFAPCQLRCELRYTLPGQENIDNDPQAPFIGDHVSDERGRGRRPVPFDWWTQELAPLTIVTPERVANHHALGHPQEIQGPMPLEFPRAVENQPARELENPFLRGKMIRMPAERRDDCPAWLIQELRDGTDWRLLLQLDSDEDAPGWMWGDCGRLYFWLPEAELRAGRFDRTWLNLECY